MISVYVIAAEAGRNRDILVCENRSIFGIAQRRLARLFIFGMWCMQIWREFCVNRRLIYENIVKGGRLTYEYVASSPPGL